MEAWIEKNYRVPPQLREKNHKAYTPQMFRIGPLHRDKSVLLSSEKEKRRYMSGYFNRLIEQGDEEKCLQLILELEQVIREWYTEDIDLDTNQLAEMILLDACFIIELLCKCNPVNIQKNTDPLLRNLTALKYLRNDLMLLENQIPFFVLQKLFDLIPQKSSIGDPGMSLQGRILWFFNSCPMLQGNISNSRDGAYRHLLDMLLYHVCNDTSKKSTPTNLISLNESNLGFTRCATELYKSGVQFTCDRSRAIMDIKFDQGELSFPQIVIDKSVDTLLRNGIALEQVSGRGHSVTSYVKMISSLIRSLEDADLLEHLGILVVKSDVETNAAAFFQNLCLGVVFGESCFTDLCQEVNEYHIPVWRWSRWKGYFTIKCAEIKKSSKDLIFSATPAVILLGSLQTYYTIRGYYELPNR